MLGFRVPKESFVATATAIGLFVDAARIPVYLATAWENLLRLWPVILVATGAVVAGTALGTRVLGQIPEKYFRRAIGVLLVILGAYMVLAAPG
jgi:uncharacterized membrane protein YfcA